MSERQEFEAATFGADTFEAATFEADTEARRRALHNDATGDPAEVSP